MVQKVPGPKSGRPTNVTEPYKENGQFIHPGRYPEIGGASGPNPRGGVKRNKLTVRRPGRK